jgi:hypothetical protein
LAKNILDDNGGLIDANWAPSSLRILRNESLGWHYASAHYSHHAQTHSAASFGPVKILCADVPLLFESGSCGLFGITIMVACHPEQRLERLRKRNPDLTEQQCRDRIQSQRSIEAKVAMADVVIGIRGFECSFGRGRAGAARCHGAYLRCGHVVQNAVARWGSLSLAVSSNCFRLGREYTVYMSMYMNLLLTVVW